jgi:hypothetical protein
LFKSLGAATLAIVALPAFDARQPATAHGKAYAPSFFTPDEWAFVNAASARLIPNDSLGHGAAEAGVPEYIDRQMGTPWATGALWYMQGPFDADAPATLGYQSQLTPQQIYRLGIAAADGFVRMAPGRRGSPSRNFRRTPRTRCLQAIESGQAVFETVPAKLFFSMLLQNVREGFFADPVHGGNRGPRRLEADRLSRGARRLHGLGRPRREVPAATGGLERTAGVSMASSTMKKADAVIVGFGWAGAIMAKELTEAGLNVVALERGPMRDTATDGAYPKALDELTYSIRRKLFQDISRETVTIRHGAHDTALPYRQLGAFLPGTGVGGAGLHWSGVHFRVDPVELRLRSHYEERYGRKFLPEGMTIQDFGVSYEELEPHFDFAEKVFGTSGTAWTGGRQEGRRRARAATRSPPIVRTTFRCPRRSAPCRRSASATPRPSWATTRMTCRRRTPPGRTRTPTAARWVRATSAATAAATPATTTRRRRPTSTCCPRCARRRTSSCARRRTCCA